MQSHCVPGIVVTGMTPGVPAMESTGNEKASATSNNASPCLANAIVGSSSSLYPSGVTRLVWVGSERS
jgi:hypothetical protein